MLLLSPFAIIGGPKSSVLKSEDAGRSENEKASVGEAGNWRVLKVMLFVKEGIPLNVKPEAMFSDGSIWNAYALFSK